VVGGANKALSDMTKDDLAGWDEGGVRAAHKAACVAGGGNMALSDMTKDDLAGWDEGGGQTAHKAACVAGGGCTVDMTKDDLALHSVRIKAKQTTRIAFNTHARNTVQRATENFDEE
jgi:hypothetical protein